MAIGIYSDSYGPYQGSGATPTPDFSATVDAQRVATLAPGSLSAANYEYQFRPGPTVSAQRSADLSQTLAAGESFSDYEYQAR